MNRFTDNGQMVEPRILADGSMVASVLCARTGCYEYLGTEVGLKDSPGVVNVYRPEETVFSRDSMDSFGNKPITIDHPVEDVTADNWSDLSAGNIVGVVREGEYIRADIHVMDAKAVKAIQDGKRELSVGYSVQIEHRDGVAPDGTKYQAVQSGTIHVNHLALVDRARAGSECRIGDDADKWGAAPITTSSKQEDSMSDALKTVVLGDKAVQVAADDVSAIDAFKADSAKALADAEATHDAAMAKKDAELAQKDAEIEKLTKSQVSDADLDKRVADRAALIDTARKIDANVKTEGLSDAEIKAAVVVAKMGDKAKDKAPAYMDAMFDILAGDLKDSDPFADAVAITTGDGNNVTSMADKYAERDKRLASAYKGKKEA